MHHAARGLFAQLDEQQITPPVEITVGPYSFYPYRGFSDIASRDDFPKLSHRHLRAIIKIMEDILAMRRPELFEAFVNDDGTIVVDKEQAHTEYSMDVDYNDSYSKIEEIYPQVAYPLEMKTREVVAALVRNDTVHEVTHHADFWIDIARKGQPVCYLHSSSTMLALCGELDGLLHPEGVAVLIDDVRIEEGYETEHLLEEGYTPERIDAMLRAEFFAILGEFYFGTPQAYSPHSPLLEAYVEYVLELDLEIQNLYIPFAEMERKRAVLRAAIHQPLGAILEDELPKLIAWREAFQAEESAGRKAELSTQIEQLVISAMARMSYEVRQKLKLKKSV